MCITSTGSGGGGSGTGNEQYTKPNEGNTAHDRELQTKAQDMIKNDYDYTTTEQAAVMTELSQNPTFDNLKEIVQMGPGGFPTTQTAYTKALDRVLKDPRTREIDKQVIRQMRKD